MWTINSKLRHGRRMPRTPKRGGGSFLPDANGHAGAAGGKPQDGDLLSNTDILYLKNVILKFIQVGTSLRLCNSYGKHWFDALIVPHALLSPSLTLCCESISTLFSRLSARLNLHSTQSA